MLMALQSVHYYVQEVELIAQTGMMRGSALRRLRTRSHRGAEVQLMGGAAYNTAIHPDVCHFGLAV